MLLLGALVYLKLTTLSLHGINCDKVLIGGGAETVDPTGTSVNTVGDFSYANLLVIDKQTPCYLADHLITGACIWIILIFLSLG